MASDEFYPDGTALVVGGSGGIGRAISEELCRRGVTVVLTYNCNAEVAEDVVARISDGGGKAYAEQLSLEDLATVERVASKTAERFGRLHSVFIATGYDIPQLPIRDLTPEQWQSVLRADADGVFNLVHKTLPLLRDGGGGSFTHISSAGLLRFPEGDILSVAPKAAIEELIRGIAKEEGKHGIRANSIAIGVIETGIFLRLKEEGVFDDQWQQAVKSMLPLDRFGQPEEVARMAVFLGSQHAAYTTGQLIPVDGGFGL